MDSWQRPLVALLSAWGASRSDAASLAQDAFVEAWLSRERCQFSLGDTAEAGPWLRGIARNLWRTHQRKRAHERPLEAAAEGASEVQDEDPRLELLWAAIARLPEPQREALWVRYIEDRTSPEAAALLGLDENALASRLWRARVALKELMDPAANAPRKETEL